MAKTVAIVSGGMDSVTLAHYLEAEVAIEEGDLHLLSVDYGQRHRVELGYAVKCAERLGATHQIADLSGINPLLAGSALTSPDMEVPEGHYADETMKQTVVPNRNAIMLSVAVGYAVSIGATRVATGVHAGDHPIYPDCRPDFIAKFNSMAQVATEGFAPEGFEVIAPFVMVSKAEIARIGNLYGVPWRETWSCYKGGSVHCGACSTCFERREAFSLAGIADPTVYDAQPQYSEPG
jgi:7-cyano-7-deazaguanine synthase